MATRAVYEFFGKNDQGLLSVYIHYDGYPEGAAMYFKKALDQTPNYLKAENEYEHEMHGNQFITNFIRYNEYAEITRGSEIHLDLEYVYKISIFSKQITTLQLNWDRVDASDKCLYELDNQAEFLDEIETCSIAQFLERHNEVIEFYNKKNKNQVCTDGAIQKN